MASKTFKVPDAAAVNKYMIPTTRTDNYTVDFTDWLAEGATLTAFNAVVTTGTGTAPTIGTGGGAPAVDASARKGTFDLVAATASGSHTLTMTGTCSNGEVKTVVGTILIG